uniref:Uncharacterized protein n=1 Tax=Amphiprion percula TaxID=161767 RepID=A0A3P8T4D1_AMPPE
MIVYLPFTALILVSHFTCGASGLDGIVDLQAANTTERNQTFTVSTNNSTTKPNNVTSSLYADEKTWIEDELESNHTSAVITEDDESFQEQEDKFPGQHCHQELLVESSHFYCGETFHQEMKFISTEKWCILKNIIRPYHEMTVCLEEVSHLVGCYFPNPDIQDFFLFIHSTYFQNCSKGEGGEEFLEDAPHGLVVLLTIVPVGFVPVLVYLVVWKSKGQV